MDEFFDLAKISAHIAAADARWTGMWGAADKVGPFNFRCGPFIPSDCWVPGSRPGQPDCCEKRRRLLEHVTNGAIHDEDEALVRAFGSVLDGCKG